ncbi:hypothetical protein HYQ46_012654 [Verticillium longisporum]|nr:hypothetical protein HYQ46_012654 [Verticillium longisporum]
MNAFIYALVIGSRLVTSCQPPPSRLAVSYKLASHPRGDHPLRCCLLIQEDANIRSYLKPGAAPFPIVGSWILHL